MICFECLEDTAPATDSLCGPCRRAHDERVAAENERLDALVAQMPDYGVSHETMRSLAAIGDILRSVRESRRV